MWKSKTAVFILTGIILMGLAALFARLFFSPKVVPITELKFPVMLVREDGSAIYVEDVPVGMQKMSMSSPRVPIGGTIVIDSDFGMYTQKNVKSGDGEIAATFRALVRPTSAVTYTFDLERRRESGLAAARERVLRCEFSGFTEAEAARKHTALAKQTTFAGMIAVLNSSEVAETEPGE